MTPEEANKAIQSAVKNTQKAVLLDYDSIRVYGAPLPLESKREVVLSNGDEEPTDTPSNTDQDSFANKIYDPYLCGHNYTGDYKRWLSKEQDAKTRNDITEIELEDMSGDMQKEHCLSHIQMVRVPREKQQPDDLVQFVWHISNSNEALDDRNLLFHVPSLGYIGGYKGDIYVGPDLASVDIKHFANKYCTPSPKMYFIRDSDSLFDTSKTFEDSSGLKYLIYIKGDSTSRVYIEIFDYKRKSITIILQCRFKNFAKELESASQSVIRAHSAQAPTCLGLSVSEKIPKLPDLEYVLSNNILYTLIDEESKTYLHSVRIREVRTELHNIHCKPSELQNEKDKLLERIKKQIGDTGDDPSRSIDYELEELEELVD